MRLQCFCRIVKIEEKVAKNDKPYLEVTIDEDFYKFPSHIFVFSEKMIERFRELHENDSVVLMYEFFWSRKNNQDVFFLKDVVVE